MAAIAPQGIGRPELLQVGRLHRMPSRRGAKRHRAQPHENAAGPPHVAWMVPLFKNPSQVVPGSAMPPINLPNPDLNALLLLVLTLTSQNEAGLLGTPAFVTQGPAVYQKNHCDALPSDRRCRRYPWPRARRRRPAPRSRLAKRTFRRPRWRYAGQHYAAAQVLADGCGRESANTSCLNGHKLLARPITAARMGRHFLH